MVVFPNCKINFGLKILHKRADGFHEIETIFYPVKIYDALEAIKSSDGDELQYSSTGLTVDTNEANNLCVKAYQLIKKDHPQLPGIKMHLHKTIPMGAGLGGGSADAAFALQLINNKFELNLSEQQLHTYALELGSDCPFFLINKPCYAVGRGELIREIPIDLSMYKLLLINPGIHVNTGWAFGRLNRGTKIIPSPQLDPADMATWTNDFETVVFQEYPEIADLKTKLLDAGAVYASMSGSGSSVFGLFQKNAEISLDTPSHYFRQTVEL